MVKRKQTLPKLENLKVALVYDKVTTWGGAERVLTTLHEIFPDAPLYTSIYNKGGASWANIFPRVISSFLQNLPGAKSKPYLYTPLMSYAFESFNFDAFDIVISITSYEAKGVVTAPHTCHICYCLTPTRYLWSEKGYEEFRPFGMLNMPVHFIKHLMLPSLRQWDRQAAIRPDEMVAISKKVARRVRRYYGRQSEIIYPPVDESFFVPRKERTKSNDYYLIVSRLVPYKRIDMAIEAFNRCDRKLKIVGSGPDHARLKSLIHSSKIDFVGGISDEQLRLYYQDCKALLMPQDEDFGICGLEALACDRPVITFARSGIAELVENGVHGMKFDVQNANTLLEAIEMFERQFSFQEGVCRKRAEAFGKESFKSSFLALVLEKYIATHENGKNN